MTGTFIEGVGDEVIYVVVTLVLAAFVSILASMGKRYNLQMIHPDSMENVQTAREHLNRVPISDSDRRRNETSCPVCLEDLYYGVETNCGHIFCARCIIAYWHYGSWLGGIKCPVCRQKVTLILICFTESETQSASQEQTNILNEIHDYNRRFSGEPRPVMDYIRDIPTLLRHFLQELFTWNGLMMMFRMRITICTVFGICYLISPLDIIPEAAFGLFGLLDDVFVLLLIVVYISIAYREFVASRRS